jgi:hypothetical protein
MGELTLFDSGAVPAHIANIFGDAGINDDLSAGVGVSFPIISIKGKTFHVVSGDERTLITNDDGDAKGSIEVVILKSNRAISKVFYANGYVEGSNEKPTCSSNDGIAPAADALEPQCNKCQICPQNVWGSRTTESGAKGKMCSDSRRIAVASPNDLENPMLLRVPAATLKELTAYSDMLTRRRVPYKAVITKIGFDHSVAHPKLTFKAVRFLTNAEAEVVVEVLERPIIDEIVGLARSEPVLDIAGAPPALLMGAPKTTAKTTAKSAIKNAVTVTEAEIAEVLDPNAEPEPEQKTAPKAAPKPAAKAAPKPAAKPVLKVVEDDASLTDILNSLESDD